jgi:DNA-binding IclR family transcriptional regulator
MELTIDKPAGLLAFLISVSGPVQRMTEQRISDEILPAVLKAANGISQKLGYRDLRHG